MATRNERAAAAAEERKAGTDVAANGEAGGPGGGAVARRDDPLRNMLAAWESEIVAQFPLQLKLNPAAFMRMVLTGLHNSKQAKALAACTRPSLYAALLEAARYGLTPFTDECAIVPYGDKATFIPMAGGFVQMFYRTNLVSGVAVDFIRSNEVRGTDWDLTRGTGTGFWHRPRFDPPDAATGRPVPPGDEFLAYCYLRMRDGSMTEPAMVTRWDAEEVMQEKSRAWQSAEDLWHRTNGRRGRDSLWHTDFPAMWRKGLALDTPIPTPAGWATMGDLAEGDLVLDRHGHPTRVTDVSEVKHLPCYRLTFTSGETITCDHEHRWVAEVGGRKELVYPVADLYAAKAGGQRVAIPGAQPAELPDADLPVDPWLLGFWLGDGNRTKPEVCCDAAEVAEVEAAIRSAGYQTTTRPDSRSRAVAVKIQGGLAKHLADLGVLGAKHVPPAYLRGSARQRLALIRGLMDSDGSVWQRGDVSGRAVFSNTSPELADAVAELARSLGEQVSRCDYDSRGFGVTAHTYKVAWSPWFMPFALAAKTGRMVLRRRQPFSHTVKSIEMVPTVPTRCIAVESMTRTYLAGRGMIPTHNTAVRRTAKYAPKSAELQELLLIEAREDRTRDDAMPVRQAPAMGSGYTADFAGAIDAKVTPGEVVHDDDPGRETTTLTRRRNGQGETLGPDGFPVGSTAAPPGQQQGQDQGGQQQGHQEGGQDQAPAGTEHAAADVPAAAADAALGRQAGDDGTLITKETGGKIGYVFTQLGDDWKGKDHAAKRLTVACLLASRGSGRPFRMAAAPGQMTEAEGLAALVAIGQMTAAAEKDGEPLAARMQRFYDKAMETARGQGQARNGGGGPAGPAGQHDADGGDPANEPPADTEPEG